MIYKKKKWKHFRTLLFEGVFRKIYKHTLKAIILYYFYSLLHLSNFQSIFQIFSCDMYASLNYDYFWTFDNNCQYLILADIAKIGSGQNMTSLRKLAALSMECLPNIPYMQLHASVMEISCLQKKNTAKNCFHTAYANRVSSLYA